MARIVKEISALTQRDLLPVADERSITKPPRFGGIARLIAPLLLCALAFLTTQVLDYDYTSHLPKSRIDVTEMNFVRSTSFFPPVQGNYGERVSLPQVWKEAGHPADREAATGWHTGSIKLNVPPNRLWVVYFPNITSNSSVYLNGEILGESLGLNEKFGQMRQRPLYLNIPNGFLKADENLLQIKVTAGHEFFGSIEPFYLGPEKDFKDVYSHHYFFKITLVKIIASLLLFSSIATGLIWIMRRNETLYGWFSLACMLWSIAIFIDFTAGMSIKMTSGPKLFHFHAITLFSVMLMLVVNRFLNKKSTVMESTVWISAFLICTILFLTPMAMQHAVCNYLVGAFALTIIAYCFFRLIASYARFGGTTNCLVAFSVAVIFFFSVGDLIASVSPDGEKYSGMSAHYAAPIFVGVLGWNLLKEFVQARDNAENLNLTLTSKIEQKTRELEITFATTEQLRKKQILAEERDRLIMDMHDGLGGQLVTAMSMLEREEFDHTTLSTTIKEALDDMRMMIDAFDPLNDDVAVVLGSYRERLERSLYLSPLNLNWRVRDVPELEGLGPHTTLQILRILQEAVNNAMKHSSADEITISTGTIEDRVFLSVEDNGVGWSDSTQGTGRGLQNMQKRAESMNAELVTSNSKDGFSLKLIF